MTGMRAAQRQAAAWSAVGVLLLGALGSGATAVVVLLLRRGHDGARHEFGAWWAFALTLLALLAGGLLVPIAWHFRPALLRFSARLGGNQVRYVAVLVALGVLVQVVRFGLGRAGALVLVPPLVCFVVVMVVGVGYLAKAAVQITRQHPGK